MSMTIHDVEQGSDEWRRVRAGIPTASEFAAVMASRTKAESKTRRTYMLKLAGEILTGEPMDSFTNRHMERGKAMEPEAREFYAFRTDTDPELIGFIRNGEKGCSPDSLIGADGMLEIKTKLPHLLADVILTGEFPEEHKAQCQGQLWVAEREWVDLLVYWPKMPPFIMRAYRDEAFIGQLSAEVERFNCELGEVIERLREFGAIEREAA